MHQFSLNTFDSFRYRNYLLLWVSSLCFVAGFRLQLIVLGWFTYDQTGSPLLTALVVSLDLVPYMLLGPVAGLMADAWDRRKLVASSFAGVTLLVVGLALLVARMCSNLDQISNGRLIFGVGVGWTQEEFKVLDVPFQHRGAMTNDYLAAIKVLWTNEVATYHGRFVSFDNVSAAPMPVQSPHPPIWVGGSSDAALLRTARFGDAWHPIRFQMDQVRDTALPQLRRLADAEHRPVPAFCPRVKLHLTDAPVTDRPRAIGVGTLSQVRSDLEELEQLGAEYVLLDTYMDDPEGTRQHEPAWQMITTLATQVLDLERENLR